MKQKGRPALLVREKEGGLLSSVAAVLIAVIFLIAVAGIWFRRNYVAYEIIGPSMERTLFDGDWVYGRQGKAAERGDIVIVDVTDRKEFRDDEAIIKRLIAVGGDTVQCRGGVVSVKTGEGDFVPIDDGSAYGTTADFGPVTLKAGEAFVMGDNREESYDSRRVGPFRYDKIVAVVPAWSVAWKSSVAAWEGFRGDVRAFFANLF